MAALGLVQAYIASPTKITWQEDYREPHIYGIVVVMVVVVVVVVVVVEVVIVCRTSQ